MANISIINYCNLKCSYCFANDMIKEKSYALTTLQLQKILNFCSITQEKVGIIGGEPTLHPEFNDILSLFKEYKLFNMPNDKITIYSNGIELEKYINGNFYDYFGLLLNINNPNNLSNDQINKTISTLDKINKDTHFRGDFANIGYNLYPGENNYNYIWDLVKKYKLDSLRISTITPQNKFKNYKSNKDGFYELMKGIFLEQCKLADKYNVILRLDCNNIPSCYFTEEELNFVQKICFERCSHCYEPVIDINFGDKISSCFGTYSQIDYSLFDFNNMDEIRRYLKIYHIYPKVIKNGTGKCATCKRYELAQCQGGCLGFVTE